MVNKELLNWIQEEISKGITKDEIGRLLRAQGWNDADLSEAFTAVSEAMAPKEVPPPVSPTMPNSSLPMVSSGSAGRPLVPKALTVTIVAISILALSSVVYAYIQKIGPFAKAPYAEDNLLSGLLNSFSSINTSAYSFSASLKTVSRDADAKPFVLQIDNEEVVGRYKNDFQRAQDVDSLFYALNSLYGEYAGRPYPANIDQVILDASKSKYYTLKNIKDPATGQKYSYAATDGGKNFTLAITFETKNAIDNIRQSAELFKTYGNKNPPTISGQTVKFKKDDSLNLSYIITPELPKPFITQMQEMISSAPAEMAVNASVSAATDWTKTNADWKFNIGASGDFGDLTYKIDADALKKSGIYYLRINNFPSLFGFPPASMKGQWAKFDPVAASSTSSGYNDASYITNYASEAEDKYKKNRADFLEILKKAADVADKTHLIFFEEAPSRDRVDNRTLYRYGLKINKSALSAFYRQMSAEVDQKNQDAQMFNDPSVEEYLQGEEFNQLFDYYLKNTTLTLWVDSEGRPAVIKYSVRIVPPDTASALKDKQFDMVYQLSISDINSPIDISTPADAKPIGELLGGEIQSSSKARDAKRISDLGAIQQALALYFDEKGKYPAGLADLVTAGLLFEQPAGPNPGEGYKYTASPDGLSYHLGTALEEVLPDKGVLASDRDCSSVVGGAPLCAGFSKGVLGGFDGSDNGSCGGASGACYDLNP